MSQQKLVVPPRSVFAAVLLNAMQKPLVRERPDWPTIVDLTNEMVRLRREFGLDTTRISVRADKGGWISDDFSSFVNGMVLFGLATENPVRLEPEATELCEDVLRKDYSTHGAGVGELCRHLGLSAVFKSASVSA
jgi:hypothetical protein